MVKDRFPIRPYSRPRASRKARSTAIYRSSTAALPRSATVPLVRSAHHRGEVSHAGRPPPGGVFRGGPRRRRIRSRAYPAAVLAALAAAIAGPTAALAVPADTQYPRPVPQTTHLTPSVSAAKVGDTPGDFGRSVAAVAKVGDTPSDFPGSTRAQATPPTA